jgi:hypothetical protein
MAEDQTEQQERRAHHRRIVCMVADMRLEPLELPPNVALVRNISLSGAYLLGRVSVASDEKLLLALHFSAGAEERVEEASATVIRVEKLEPGESSVWTVGFAVRFEPPLDHLSDAIEEAAAFAASVGYDR